VATSLQDTVEDGLAQVGIIEDLGPRGKGFAGDEEDKFALEVAFVNDLEEDVGGVVRKAEVADLLDDQNVGVDVVMESLGQPAGGSGV